MHDFLLNDIHTVRPVDTFLVHNVTPKVSFDITPIFQFITLDMIATSSQSTPSQSEPKKKLHTSRHNNHVDLSLYPSYLHCLVMPCLLLVWSTLTLDRSHLCTVSTWSSLSLMNTILCRHSHHANDGRSTANWLVAKHRGILSTYHGNIPFRFAFL